jgi:hypothetical protein
MRIQEKKQREIDTFWGKDKDLHERRRNDNNINNLPALHLQIPISGIPRPLTMM